MNKLYMYADESCHIQNDGNNVMSLVTVYCKDIHRKLIANRIKQIMSKYNINPLTELKWNKIGNKNLQMYKDIITYMKKLSDTNDLNIRALVAMNKEQIKGQYDDWYYRMYYTLFRKVIDDNRLKYSKYHLFIDEKDNKSYKIIPRVGKILTNYTLWSEDLIGIPSNSRNHILIQIADIIAGSLSYYYRKEQHSLAKLDLMYHIQKTFNVDYSYKSQYDKNDFNLFIWSTSHAKTIY